MTQGQASKKREEAAGRAAKGRLSDQAPKGAHLNFQGEGEAQKAKQSSYAAVAQGATVPGAKPVDAVPNKPVSAAAAARPGGGRGVHALLHAPDRGRVSKENVAWSTKGTVAAGAEAH